MFGRVLKNSNTRLDSTRPFFAVLETTRTRSLNTRLDLKSTLLTSVRDEYSHVPNCRGATAIYFGLFCKAPRSYCTPQRLLKSEQTFLKFAKSHQSLRLPLYKVIFKWSSVAYGALSKCFFLSIVV